MFDSTQAAFLKRHIGLNNCVLFLGAGFCWGMTNKLGSRMPLGSELTRILWREMGFDAETDPPGPLSDVFQVATRKFSRVKLQEILEQNLTPVSIPDKYNALAMPYWHRIYTVNVDDSLSQIYQRTKRQKLKIVAHPRGELSERDQFLSELQCIFLHGKLPCDPSDLTFSTKQYAGRATGHDHLYDNFVRDYATHPTIFLGTELSEPIFFQYVEARGKKDRDRPELRLKSFLVSRKISASKREILSDYNVVPIEATTDEFLDWLETVSAELPSKEQVIKGRLPTIGDLRGAADERVRDKDLQQFAQGFHEVPLEQLPKAGKSFFLLGSSPRWEDIHDDLDIPRDLMSGLIKAVEGYLDPGAKPTVLGVLGYSGSGKSTLVRRLGLSIAQRGWQVFLTNCEQLPKPESVARVLDGLSAKAMLIFDNAEGALGYIATLAKVLASEEKMPLIIVASRSNEFIRKFPSIGAKVDVVETYMPNLSANEIPILIEKLEQHHLLGRLRGLSPERRIREFSVRAQKQILVAMREATNGANFDKIIKGEFEGIDGSEAKELCLAVALATDAGYRITRQEFVGCARVTSSEALFILEKVLRDMVLRTGASEDLLMLRHRAIAEHVLTVAPRDMLQGAYLRLLTVIAQTPEASDHRSKYFRFYRVLVNHETILERFPGSIDLARSVYDGLRDVAASSAHFWLQYGCLELQEGDSSLAMNYLNQSESLDGQMRFVKNAKGHLLMKMAVSSTAIDEARRLRGEGKRLLLDAYERDRYEDPYYFGIVGRNDLLWIRKWIRDAHERKRELDELRRILDRGLKIFPRNREISDLKEEVMSDYLHIAT